VSITYSNNALRVDGKKVATFESERAFEIMRDALFENLSRDAATLFALSLLGEATTAEVADLLGHDRSNTYRRLCTLVEQGKAVIVDEAYHDGLRGRPTHVWRVAPAR